MEPIGSMPHSQQLSGNPYPEPNQPILCIDTYLRSVLILSFHLCLDLPICHFPVGLPVKILKALLPSSIIAIYPPHINFLKLIALTILGEWYKP